MEKILLEMKNLHHISINFYMMPITKTMIIKFKKKYIN